MAVASTGARGKRIARGLALALAVSAAGAVLGGFIPFLGGVGALVGIGAAHFAWGLLGGPRSRYALAGVGGAALGALVTFTDYAVLALAGVGSRVVLVGAAGGALLALAGRYFGADLRAGFTKEL
jgi:hypothetical protein